MSDGQWGKLTKTVVLKKVIGFRNVLIHIMNKKNEIHCHKVGWALVYMALEVD